MAFRVSVRALPILSAVLLGLGPTVVRAQECDGLDAARSAVCRTAVTQIGVLEATWPSAAAGGAPCEATRVLRRLQGLVRRLRSMPADTPYLALEFDVRTDTVQEAPPDAVGYTREVLFQGEADEVTVTTEDGFPLDRLQPEACVARVSTADTLKAAAVSMSKAIAAFNRPALSEGAAALKKLADTWLWVITDGFGQFPWERVLNDALDRTPMSVFELPTTEWILLHPSVGAEFSGSSGLSDARVNGSLFIEPIGFVRYRFQLRQAKRQYWGMSALVVLSSDLSPGYGALLRYGTYALGVVNRPASTAPQGSERRSWGVTATVELLERLQSPRRKLAGAQALLTGELRPPQ